MVTRSLDTLSDSIYKPHVEYAPKRSHELNKYTANAIAVPSISARSRSHPPLPFPSAQRHLEHPESVSHSSHTAPASINNLPTSFSFSLLSIPVSTILFHLLTLLHHPTGLSHHTHNAVHPSESQAFTFAPALTSTRTASTLPCKTATKINGA